MSSSQALLGEQRAKDGKKIPLALAFAGAASVALLMAGTGSAGPSSLLARRPEMLYGVSSNRG